MLDELNEMQKKAVRETEGPVLVLAGAGSGKTKVLTTRIAYLIKEKNVAPYNILAITFTNKAAKEMKDRLAKSIGDDIKYLQVSTFHSFGLRIIRENYEKCHLNANFTILDSDDSVRLIKRILKEKGYTPKDVSPSRIKNIISSAKNEILSPLAFEKTAKTPDELIAADVYKDYEKLISQSNSVDFDDLLLVPLDLLLKDEEVLAHYQEKFKYILIDEYQDTNEVQYRLANLLADKYKNLCCVGDNDQSIYSFRGANFRNILNFENDYDNPLVIKLEQNYRSTKRILAAANSVIKHNEERKDKNLWSDLELGDKVKYYNAENEDDEASFIAKEIKRLNEDGLNLKDIAVIYRTNAQSRTFEDKFNYNGIPYQLIGSLSYYSRKEIKDLLAYLNLIYNTDNDIALERIINTPRRGIGKQSLDNLMHKASSEGKAIFNFLESPKEKAFKDLILDLKKDSETLSITDLVENVLKKSGMREALKEEDTLDAEIRIENLEEFKTVTKNYEDENGEHNLEEFLYEMALLSDKNTDVEGVSLMTVHSVKGLEFPCVFLAGMEEGIFPHQNSLYSRDDLEEERRLCYVAITRAKKLLYITSAKARRIYGRLSECIKSRFLSEIDEDLMEEIGAPKKINIFRREKTREREVKKDIDYQVGDLVYHERFGKGIIREIEGNLITINFSYKYGTKSVIKSSPKLDKYKEE